MRKILSVSVLALTLALNGCLIDAIIDAKGGGEVTVSYKMPKTGKIDDVKKQMESPDVKVISATVDAQSMMATFKMKVEDITKLSTAKFFKTTTITVTEDKAKGTKTIVAKIINKTPAKLPDKVLEFYGDRWEVSATLPGEIVETNATSKDGKTAHWKKTLQEYSGAREHLLSVTYKVPAS